MESRADCVLCGTFGPVCELKGVQGGGEDGLDVRHD